MNTQPTTRSAANALRAVFLACLGLLSTAYSASAMAADESLPGDVLLRLRSTAALGPLLIKHQLSLVSQFGARPIYRAKAAGTVDIEQKVEALSVEPDVLLVERNAVHRSPEARRNVPWAIGAAADYTAQWAPAALRLPQAHRLSLGRGIRVAVLDTGVDGLHPALAGRLVEGFDFVDFDRDPSEVGSPAQLSHGHGTHVAGLVALAAPAATIMPLRVLDAEGLGNAWVLAEAMLHAVDPDGNSATQDGAHIINLSLGSTRRSRVLDSVIRLAACALPDIVVEPDDDFTDPGYNADRERCAGGVGAVVVAAAGNDASRKERQYPAAEGEYGLLSVAASQANGHLAAFSNFGTWVDVAAPGDGITSALPGGGHGTWSGTSMAAPLACGVAALLLSNEPGLSPRDVTRRLTRTSAALCNTRLRQIDATAALLDREPAAVPCR